MDSLWTRGVAAACIAATCLGWPEAAPARSVLPRPPSLRATIDRTGTVRLRWRAGGATFAVYRRVVADAAGVRCGCTRRRLGLARRGAWTDRSVRAGFEYGYSVAAVSRLGARGRLSSPAIVTIPLAPAARAPAAPAKAAPVEQAPPIAAPVASTPAPATPAPAPVAPAAPPSVPAGMGVPSAAATPTGPATRFVALHGADRGGCDAAAPCATLGYAYEVARPGEVVEVAGGDYGLQAIPLVASRSGAPVVFRPAAGAKVALGGIDVYGSHVELRDFATPGWYVKEGASDVTLRDVTADGPVFITGASQVRVLGGSVGPGDSEDSQIKAADNVGAPVPSDIVIDGVDFHDWTRVADPSAHVECLQIGAGVRITIRNSVFRDCATHGLFVRSWGGSMRIANLDIEHNWFGATEVGYYALRVAINSGVVYRGIRVAYNTALQPLHIDAGAATGVTLVGNTVSGG